MTNYLENPEILEKKKIKHNKKYINKKNEWKPLRFIKNENELKGCYIDIFLKELSEKNKNQLDVETYLHRCQEFRIRPKRDNVLEGIPEHFFKKINSLQMRLDKARKNKISHDQYLIDREEKRKEKLKLKLEIVLDCTCVQCGRLFNSEKAGSTKFCYKSCPTGDLIGHFIV